jgi:predicted phosphate transport protein (TIGR00153 family)
VFRKLLPRKNDFFRLMEEAAGKVVEIVGAFGAMLDHLDEAQSRVAGIKDIEHAADELLHRVLGDLHVSFVTPLDRNEISTICKRLDDIVDLVEGAAQRMYHYDLREATPPLRRLVQILSEQADLVRKAVHGLSDLRNPKGLRETLIQIHTLENHADDVLRPTIGALIREEKDPRVILKWKEVYEHIEKATDRCEDVADNIENVLLEYA